MHFNGPCAISLHLKALPFCLRGTKLDTEHRLLTQRIRLMTDITRNENKHLSGSFYNFNSKLNPSDEKLNSLHLTTLKSLTLRNKAEEKQPSCHVLWIRKARSLVFMHHSYL